MFVPPHCECMAKVFPYNQCIDYITWNANHHSSLLFTGETIIIKRFATSCRALRAENKDVPSRQAYGWMRACKWKMSSIERALDLSNETKGNTMKSIQTRRAFTVIGVWVCVLNCVGAMCSSSWQTRKWDFAINTTTPWRNSGNAQSDDRFSSF